MRTRELGRTGALALLLMAVGALASLHQVSKRMTNTALTCPKEQLRVDERGVVGWLEGGPLPAGARLTLGLKLDLNRATLEDLQLLDGVGPGFAKALVSARTAAGGFRDWEAVDRISGVGAVRLEALKACAEIR